MEVADSSSCQFPFALFRGFEVGEEGEEEERGKTVEAEREGGGEQRSAGGPQGPRQLAVSSHLDSTQGQWGQGCVTLSKVSPVIWAVSSPPPHPSYRYVLGEGGGGPFPSTCSSPTPGWRADLGGLGLG